MANVPDLDLSAIARVCERFGVVSLRVSDAALNGDSALTDERTPPTSPITCLVEFGPQATRDFGSFFALGDELQRIIGRPVELFDRGDPRSPDLASSRIGGTRLVYPV